MSAGSSAPVAVDGDYVIAGAGAALSSTQRDMIIAYKLGATGKLPRRCELITARTAKPPPHETVPSRAKAHYVVGVGLALCTPGQRDAGRHSRFSLARQ